MRPWRPAGSRSRATGRERTSAARRAIRRRSSAPCEHLLARQDAAGWWKGELADERDDGRRGPAPARVPRHPRAASRPPRSRDWIRSQQRADGSWANFHDGPGDLSTTIEAYVALRLAGDAAPTPSTCAPPPRSSATPGGVERARVFTHIWLALFGAWPWRRVPELPPELMLLPLARADLDLRLRVLGAPDRRRDVDRARRAPARTALPFAIDELHGPDPWRRPRGTTPHRPRARPRRPRARPLQPPPAGAGCARPASRAPSAGSCAARRPTAPGAGSSRRGSTR